MHSKTTLILGIVLIVGLTGCVTHRINAALPEPRPLGQNFPTYQPPPEPSAAISAPLQLEEPTGIITLRQALSLALLKNPELVAFSWEIRAREARTLQAGLRPNPEISATVDDFAGTGVFRGVRQSLTHIQLSQLIELGGKRAARVRVASLTRDLAGWDYETKRIDILTQVTKAFIEVLSAQQRVALTQETGRLAEEVATTVSERVTAGKVSPVEETRANVARSSARIELERAKRALAAARQLLAATWGSTTPRFEKADGELDAVPASMPSLPQLAERLSQNPELARWAAELSQRQAVVAVEKSRAVPDLTIGGAYRQLNVTGDNAFVVGVTVPLPLFNRNQGAILEARDRLAKAEEERRDGSPRHHGAG